MKVNYSDEDVIKGEKSIFLAALVTNWQYNKRIL